mmetsp:Transcript_2207/g.6207  ORF Transcript_2207/g.6207 Transcript_2207/m.6207 type:complete len:289 (+) Transcript_2207:405-1271(+)
MSPRIPTGPDLVTGRVRTRARRPPVLISASSSSAASRARIAWACTTSGSQARSAGSAGRLPSLKGRRSRGVAQTMAVRLPRRRVAAAAGSRKKTSAAFSPSQAGAARTADTCTKMTGGRWGGLGASGIDSDELVPVVGEARSGGDDGPSLWAGCRADGGGGQLEPASCPPPCPKMDAIGVVHSADSPTPPDTGARDATSWLATLCALSSILRKKPTISPSRVGMETRAVAGMSTGGSSAGGGCSLAAAERRLRSDRASGCGPGRWGASGAGRARWAAAASRPTRGGQT